MNDIRLHALDLYSAGEQPAANGHTILFHSVLARFNAARKAAAIERLRHFLAGGTRCFLNLNTIPSGQVRGRHYGGIKTVSLD